MMGFNDFTARVIPSLPSAGKLPAINLLAGLGGAGRPNCGLPRFFISFTQG
jgi:hypothetical protein